MYKNQCDALYIAARNSDTKLIAFYLSQDPKDIYKLDLALKGASYANNIKIIKYLIKKGAGRKKGWTMALEGACEGNHKDLIDFYMDQGGGLDDNYDSAAYYSGVGGHYDLVKFFIKKGASVEYALQGAICGNHYLLIEKLKKNIVVDFE